MLPSPEEALHIQNRHRAQFVAPGQAKIATFSAAGSTAEAWSNHGRSSASPCVQHMRTTCGGVRPL